MANRYDNAAGLVKRLKSWEECARTWKPIKFANIADAAVQEIREELRHRYPQALAQHDAGKEDKNEAG